mmetsp:Transcript_69069/g.138892  ORF Transcript_69069/g.138892 Transcript_69069/m.138892 type:complete len:247 (-) Transcript_69069:330-1070(-)
MATMAAAEAKEATTAACSPTSIHSLQTRSKTLSPTRIPLERNPQALRRCHRQTSSQHGQRRNRRCRHRRHSCKNEVVVSRPAAFSLAAAIETATTMAQPRCSGQGHARRTRKAPEATDRLAGRSEAVPPLAPPPPRTMPFPLRQFLPSLLLFVFVTWVPPRPSVFDQGCETTARVACGPCARQTVGGQRYTHEEELLLSAWRVLTPGRPPLPLLATGKLSGQWCLFENGTNGRCSHHRLRHLCSYS